MRESVSILDKKVSDLRRLITLKCGFPVSVYCLRTPEGLEMFDCNTLKDYRTDIGTAHHISRQPLHNQSSLIPDFTVFQEKMESRFLYADCILVTLK